MKAVVTGCNGYIGSVLCKALKQLNYQVIGIDRLYRTNKYVDLMLVGDFVDLLPNFLDCNPGCSVFHLAANSLLGPSADNPIEYFENNSAKTLRILPHFKNNGHSLIFASTAAVYKDTEALAPIPETALIDPPNYYGLSKLYCEQMIEAADISATAFRFFNVIGAWDDVGQQPNTPHIINKLIDNELAWQRYQRGESGASYPAPFYVYGDDYPTRDGTCVRDYVHVRDICAAMIHQNQLMWDEGLYPNFDVYNLGTKKGKTVKEILLAYGDVIQTRQPLFSCVSRRVGDPAVLIADPSRFVRETDFKYQYSNDLVQMIQSAWEYRLGAIHAV